MGNKKYGMIFGIMFVCAVLFSTCNNAFEQEINMPVDAGYGKISINFTGEHAAKQMARTVFPSTVFDKYVYNFTKLGEEIGEEINPDTDGFFTLEVGIYKVIVQAFIGDEEPILVATGESAEFTVGPGYNDPVEVFLSVSGTNSEEKGFFSYTITFPADAEAVIILEKWPTLTNIELEPSDLAEGNVITETLELEAGSYLLTVLIQKTGLYAGVNEAVHIYPLLTTVYTKNYNDNDLITKLPGAAVSAPTLQENTRNSITIFPVNPPANGQSVEYGISTSNNANTATWQSGLTFSILDGGIYYIFARSIENDDYTVGVASASLQVMIVTTTAEWNAALTSIRNSGSGTFDIPKTYNINVYESIAVPGSSTTNTSFGSVQYIEVILRGSVTLSLDSNGSILHLGSNQTIVVDDENLILQGHSSNNTAVLSVGLGGVLKMKNGTIKGNTGGGVFVSEGGTFTMSGGTISDNTGGGVFVSGSGTFTMSGGTISDNTNSSDSGGGVSVSDNGSSFIMTGGKINNNTTGIISSTSRSGGGGVSVTNNGHFSMMSGEISGNTVSLNSGNRFSGGGGVYVRGSFSMSGGIIHGNASSISNADADINNMSYNNGSIYGGVYIDGGLFTMSGGKISDNTVEINSGAYSGVNSNVCVSFSGGFTKTGGIIAGIENFEGLAVYSRSNGYRYATLYEDDNIGINTNWRDPVPLHLQVEITSTSQWNATLATIRTIGGGSIGSPRTLTIIIKREILVSGIDYGNIYNRNLAGLGTVPYIEVTLKGSGELSQVSNGTVLPIYPNQKLIIDDENLTLQGHSWEVISVLDGGTLELRNGTISGNTGGVWIVGSSNISNFIMSGGTISGNTAYGVYIWLGSFTMSGGTISGNSSRGVWGSNGSDFTMTGGTISGNGRGVEVIGGFTKTGGIIYGNDAGVDSNISDSGNGHAVYWNRSAVDGGPLTRNTTLNVDDDISTDDPTYGWDLKSPGAIVDAPIETASRTFNRITINAVDAPDNGQTVEYAISTTNSAPVTGWQSSTTFTGLIVETTYYIFARSAGNASYHSGVASAGFMVTTPRAPGGAVNAPSGTSSLTFNSITINAVATPGNGQTVEYAISTTNSAPVTGWQSSTTFTGLIAETTYYIFARSAGNTNYNTGTASSSFQVTTPPPSIIHLYAANAFQWGNALETIRNGGNGTTTHPIPYTITINGNIAIDYGGDFGSVQHIEVTLVGNGQFFIYRDYGLIGFFSVGRNQKLIINDSNLFIETINDNLGVRMGVAVSDGGTFELKNGTIRNFVRGVQVFGGSFIMTGGTISGSSSGGVHVIENGIFNMSGGSISGNTASSDRNFGSTAGGVNVNNGTFTMSGGSISYNTAGDPYGGSTGGVYVFYGTFTMSGGTIIGNTGRLGGGGVSIDTFTTFTMTGGTILGNTANTNGGGVYIGYDCNFTKSGGGIIYGNNEVASWNRNTAGSGNGHAVYSLGSPVRFRNTTLGDGDNISTSSASGWGQ